MGVVYKLKDDVIEYILGTKKQTPNISCRKMVDLVYSRFQLKVSKSSVNNLFKEASLSAPVGRRPSGEKKTATFKIPAERKKNILNESLKQKVGLNAPPPTEKRKTRIKQKIDSTKLVKQKHHKTPPDEHKPKSPKPVPKDVPAEKGVYYDGMGCFFLKAAEWAFSKESVPGTILAKHISNFSADQVVAASEVLTFMEAFGIQEPSDIVKYGNQGLWVLNGFKGVLDYRLLLGIVEQVTDIRGFNIEMSNLISQLIEEIAFMKVELNNGGGYLIDAQMSTIWNGNVQKEFSSPTNKVIEAMSKQIINNLTPTTICSASGLDDFSEDFYQFIASYENLSKYQIQRISLYDSGGQDMADFSTVPNKKRSFIAGAWPWQAEFKRFEMESAGLPIHKLYQPVFDRAVFYQELYSNFANERIKGAFSPLRVFMLHESETGGPVAGIICNISASEWSPEKVIQNYLLRWPNLQRGHSLFSLRNADAAHFGQTNSGDAGMDLQTGFQGTLNLRMNFHNFFRVLHGYCQRHFFPYHHSKTDISAIKSIFYNLPGFLNQTKDLITVRLVLPEDGYLYREDLEYSIKRLNESNAHDPAGRRLLLLIHSG